MTSGTLTRPLALILVVALLVGAGVAGVHRVALAAASSGAVLAGEVVVICSNGVLKTVRLGADGKPVQDDGEAAPPWICDLCPVYTSQATLPATASPDPVGYNALEVSILGDRATPVVSHQAVSIRGPPAAS